MIELSDINIEMIKHRDKNIVNFNGSITNSIEYNSPLDNLENNEKYSEKELIEDTEKEMKESFLGLVYGDISDDVVRIAERVMSEVKDPTVSASIYADLEILYEKLNSHKT